MKTIKVSMGLILLLSAFGMAANQSTASPAYWTYDDFVQKKIPQPYTLRTGHPRIWITPENREDLRQKVKAAPGIWKKVIEDAEKGSGAAAIYSCAAIYQLGLVEGYKYALTQDEYGRKGVRELMRFEILKIGKRRKGNSDVASKEEVEQGMVVIPPAPTKMSGGAGVKGGGADQAHFVIPCGYDWLFEILTPEQKKNLVDQMIALEPYYVDGPCILHGVKMILGITFYGDGINDAKAREMVEREWKEWWDPHAPSKNILSFLLYSQDSGSPDGYMNCRHKILPVFAAWKTVSGQDFFANMGFFRKLPEYMTSRLVPAIDGQMLQLPLHNYLAGSLRGMSEGMVMATGYLKEVDPHGAALARWWANKANETSGRPDERNLDHPLIQGLLIGDPRVQPKSPWETQLPKSHLFGGGVNSYYARTSWEDPDASVLGYASSRYPSLRIQKSYNCFSFWKNGGPVFPYRGQLAHHFYVDPQKPLSNETRFYKGNTLLLSRGDRGSRAPNGSSAVGKEIGTPLSVASQEDAYDFVRSHSLGFDGVSRNERSLFYLHPSEGGKIDYMVILDRVKVEDKEVVPHVIFQAAFEPVISKDWSAEDKGAQVFEGQWKMENSPQAMITHEYAPYQSHVRAFLKVLYPSDIHILKIGGEKRFADTIDGKGTAEDTNLHAVVSGSQNLIESGGAWRFHVVPKESMLDYTVLTGVEMTDSKQARPSGSLELLQSDNLLGARVGCHMVIFSRKGDMMDSGSIKVSSQGLRQIAVADLKPDTEHSITWGGREVASGRSSSAGTLFVQAASWPAGDLMEIRRK